jgi:hypothetical protein
MHVALNSNFELEKKSGVNNFSQNENTIINIYKKWNKHNLNENQ